MSLRILALGSVLGALAAVAAPAVHAGTITLPGISCTYNSMTADANGNLSFTGATCSTGSGGVSCSPSASPSAIPANTTTQVSLTSNCSGSPDSFTWSGSPSPVSPNAANTTVSIPAGSSGSYTFTLEASNGSSTDTKQVTVNVQSGGSTPVSCNNPVASPSSVSANTATTINLSVSCSGSPDQFVWSGNPTPSGNGNTATVNVPASSAGTQWTFSVVATNTSNNQTSGTKSVTVSVPTPPPAGTSCPAEYQPAGPVINNPTLSWAGVSGSGATATFLTALSTYKGRTGYLTSSSMPQGTTAALLFDVPSSSGFARFEWTGNINFGSATAAISPCPGDTTQYVVANCKWAGGNDIQVSGMSASPNTRYSCRVPTSSKLYFNVRSDQTTIGLQITPYYSTDR